MSQGCSRCFKRGELAAKLRDCLVCRQRRTTNYMVKDSVWEAAGLEPKAGYVHLACLEEILGRKLVIEDFKQVPANEGIFHGFQMALVHVAKGGL